ncbi:hypothetical protein P8452_76950 [Trifolium repens]|nr:hypothetical protein P8452_76950 [Trifolium repens]
MAGVGSRTRSKNVPLFGCFSLEKKKKRVGDSFVYLGSVSSCKKTRKQNEEVIIIDSDNESDHQQFSDKKMCEGCSDDVKNENSEEDSDDSSEENETSDDDFEVHEVNEISDSDREDTSSSRSPYVFSYNKKCGISTKPLEKEEIEKSSMKGSSKINEVSKKQDKKSVDSTSRAFVDENQKAIKKKLSVPMVEDSIKDSQGLVIQVKENLRNLVYKDNGKANANDDSARLGDSCQRKSPRFAVSLQIQKSAKHKTVENKGKVQRGGNSIGKVVLEVKDDYGVSQQDTCPQVCKETPSLYWSLGKKVEEAAPKTKEEEMICELWGEMDRVSREDEAESMIGNIGTNEASNNNMEDPFSHCNHDTRLDEEIGVYCRLCGLVVTEIRYISEPLVDRYPNEGSGRRAPIGGDDVSLFDRPHFNVSDDDSNANFYHNECTVWDKIPDVKKTLYPHQQEGFEFMWKSLAGSIELQKLKNADPRSEGGCIISHAPGTGKTRLTIVFLKAYLQVFPKCMPIIIAPSSILLTWEEEFKKWDIGVPFHNLSNRELSVKPSFPDTILPELKRFCHERGRKSSKNWTWEPVSCNTRNTSNDKIKRLKLLMDPFVHVHKGAILESKLPGLRDCLVTLEAGSLQNEILKIIKRSQNTVFNFEYKIALTSVHPSLLLECDLSEEEESELDKDQLEKIRLNPYEGLKTKFLCEFVRLCDSLNEKVLVFSQYHAPLRLIKDQLNSVFNWSDREVMFMSSDDPPKVKQSIIHSFNDENSKAKILLAATRACSEGISLVEGCVS